MKKLDHLPSRESVSNDGLWHTIARFDRWNIDVSAAAGGMVRFVNRYSGSLLWQGLQSEAQAFAGALTQASLVTFAPRSP